MGLACKKTSDSKSICEFMGWKSGHNQMSKLVYMGQIRVDSGSIRLKRGHLRSKWALILPKIAGRLGKDSPFKNHLIIFLTCFFEKKIGKISISGILCDRIDYNEFSPFYSFFGTDE